MSITAASKWLFLFTGFYALACAPAILIAEHFSWGTHATVVRPKALAERMRHTARDLLHRYDNLLNANA